jgi:hypothetical protein
MDIDGSLRDEVEEYALELFVELGIEGNVDVGGYGGVPVPGGIMLLRRCGYCGWPAFGLGFGFELLGFGRGLGDSPTGGYIKPFVLKPESAEACGVSGDTVDPDAPGVGRDSEREGTMSGGGVAFGWD